MKKGYKDKRYSYLKKKEWKQNQKRLRNCLSLALGSNWGPTMENMSGKTT